jgi:hypothetical protein
MASVIDKKVTFFGTNQERLSVDLKAADPFQATGTSFEWVTPEGDHYDSTGDGWVQRVRKGGEKNYPLYASGALMSDDAHSRIHQGVMYTASYRTASLSNDASITLVITTPSDDFPHIVADPAIGGAAHFDFYENATITGGTAVAANNHNRNSANTFGGTVVHSPTVTNIGSPLLLGYYIPGGTGGTASGSSSVGFDSEWPLKPSTSYLFELTNKSGQARGASITITFYSAPLIKEAA